MAGHPQWSKVKRSKAALDAVRGQIFGRLAKESILVARNGSGSPAANPRQGMVIFATGTGWMHSYIGRLAA